MSRRPPPCPECGKPTALGGRFCHACGWDAALEESEDAYLDGVDLPEREEPPPASGRRLRWIVAVLLLAIMAWSLLRWGSPL